MQGVTSFYRASVIPGQLRRECMRSGAGRSGEWSSIAFSSHRPPSPCGSPSDRAVSLRILSKSSLRIACPPSAAFAAAPRQSEPSARAACILRPLSSVRPSARHTPRTAALLAPADEGKDLSAATNGHAPAHGGQSPSAWAAAAGVAHSHSHPEPRPQHASASSHSATLGISQGTTSQSMHWTGPAASAATTNGKSHGARSAGAGAEGPIRFEEEDGFGAA